MVIIIYFGFDLILEPALQDITSIVWRHTIPCPFCTVGLLWSTIGLLFVAFDSMYLSRQYKTWKWKCGYNLLYWNDSHQRTLSFPQLAFEMSYLLFMLFSIVQCCNFIYICIVAKIPKQRHMIASVAYYLNCGNMLLHHS